MNAPWCRECVAGDNCMVIWSEIRAMNILCDCLLSKKWQKWVRLPLIWMAYTDDEPPCVLTTILTKYTTFSFDCWTEWNAVIAHYVYMDNNPILFSLKNAFAALLVCLSFLFSLLSYFAVSCVRLLGFHRFGQMQSTITCTLNLFPLSRTSLFTSEWLQAYNALTKMDVQIYLFRWACRSVSSLLLKFRTIIRMKFICLNTYKHSYSGGAWERDGTQ